MHVAPRKTGATAFRRRVETHSPFTHMAPGTSSSPAPDSQRSSCTGCSRTARARGSRGHGPATHRRVRAALIAKVAGDEPADPATAREFEQS